MTTFTLLELRRGKVRPLGPKGVSSGIFKERVEGALKATPDGLEGDEQGDRRHHGGPEKALHAYPACHYAAWAGELPEQAELFRPGAFGENLVVGGLSEEDLCLGDRWSLGGCLLEVSQGRQPCWRLNLRFGRRDMARLVQQSGRSGWYFRVLRAGVLQAGDVGHLEARPNPRWTIQRTTTLLYRDCLNQAALAEFAALPGLPESWRQLAEKRLSSGQTEDWSRRIETPA
ncbi:MAG TPA: MOSC domain-containing protein [Kiloniellales bacterium]|jgi:MOSC domain-containing protein YiiM|nr:MOSC domain-containing protein [Kiloniellales bacterium]